MLPIVVAVLAGCATQAERAAIPVEPRAGSPSSPAPAATRPAPAPPSAKASAPPAAKAQLPPSPLAKAEPKSEPPPSESRPASAAAARAGEPDREAPSKESTKDSPTLRGKPFATVFFAFGSDRLDEDSAAVLDQVTRHAKTNPRARVLLEAHTDDRGSREFNLALAERRAAAVEQALVERGLPLRQLMIVSFGEELTGGQAKSRRRVDIRIGVPDGV